MPVAAAVVDDRHECLAGHVAAEDDHIGLVVLAAVEELAPAHLRSVHVGGKEDPHCSTSSGSSYQRLRSPILARSFQPRLFGACSMRSSTPSRRPPIRSRSGSASG